MITRPTRPGAMFLAVTLVVVLVPIGGGSAAAVAADPPQIGFASGESPAASGDPVDVYVANADGSGKINLTAGFGSTYQWAWSPDGSQIAFISHRDGAAKLFVRELSGPAPFAVAEETVSDIGFRWSPDGGSIAFVSGQDDNSEIYVADVAARTARNVSQDARRSFGPRWSPTGSHLAYTVRNDEAEDVYIVALSGGPPVNATNDAARSPGGVWSPDGSRFAFVSNRDGNDEIYVADAAGRNPVRLTDDPANDRDPSWSPDGSQIAFSSGLATRSFGIWEVVIPSRIYLMNADGSSRRPLTDGSIDPAPSDVLSLAHTGPTWSPDGSRLAMAVTLTGSGPLARSFTVYMVDVDGGGAPLKLRAGWGSWSVAWSPDSDHLAIGEANVVGGNGVIVPATGGPTVNTGEGFGSGRARWSTYGTHTEFGSGGTATGPGDVYVAGPDGTMPVNITADLPGPHNGVSQWRPQPEGPVGLVDTSTGKWHLRDPWGWIQSFYYGNPGDLPFMGDWDCDGVDTPGLFRQLDAYVYLRNSNTAGIADIRFFFGNPGDVPLAGDFNGDGCDTVSIYRPSEGRFFIINKLGVNEGGIGAAETNYLFGNPGDKPFVGDFDGDGVDTVGLHRESTGLVYLRQSHTQGIADAQFIFGDPGDRLIAGDWGIVDGVDSPAVFRPTDTTFFFRHTLTEGVADSQFVFGEPGWLPVAGEYGLG